jgi:hypothetical protein
MQWILSSKGDLKRDSFLDMKEGSFHKHIYVQHCMCVWKSTYLHCLAFWAQAGSPSRLTHTFQSSPIYLYVLHSSSVMIWTWWRFVWRNNLHSYKCKVMWVRLTKHMNRYLQHLETFGLFIAYISLVQDLYILWDFWNGLKISWIKMGVRVSKK